MRRWIPYASAGARNNEFFEFICLIKCLQVVGDGFIFVERYFPTSEKKMFKSSHCFWHSQCGSPLLKEENHYTFRTIPQEHWLVEVSMARPS